MGSVGDESHDFAAKEGTENCRDLKVDGGLPTQNVIGVQDAELHEAEILKTEAVATQHPIEVQEAQKDEVPDAVIPDAVIPDAEVPEVEVSDAEAPEVEVSDAVVPEVEVPEPDDYETGVPEVEVHDAVGPASQNPGGVIESHKENVVDDELSEKFSAVMGITGTDARDPSDPKPASSTAEEEDVVVPVVKRKLPEVKRFSARRSGGGGEDPNLIGSDTSMAPSTVRRLRSAQKLSARRTLTPTGIDDRDTVDYTVDYAVDEPRPKLRGISKEALAVVKKKEHQPGKQQQQLSVAERERLRLAGISRKKDYEHFERIRGKVVNITEGLELHTGMFSRVEQDKLVDMVKDLQAKGRRQGLKERTYSEPRKWMRGKGRVTLQFGCCYNYAIDKFGNPPGILRDEVVDPIPPLLRSTIKRLVRWHVLPPSCVPDSCIINIYEEGDCIPPHIDHHDFLRPFCTLSLVSECSIVFGSSLEILGPGDFGGDVSISLPKGSVLVLNGNGADVAKHAVPAVPTDRISITFRKMDPSKVPVGFAIDQDLENLKPVSLPS